MKTVIIDDEEYVPASECKELDSPVKIVILQRGWAMVGRFERKDSECKLHDASVIRVWGTTKGLGEIAKDGPTSSTKLDKCNGLVEFDYLTVVATLSCDDKKWSKVL
jgi:hypothetical protein